MARIVTLTMNPAVDKNTSVDYVMPESKLRCARPTREPGGGGLNVSRAIQRLGGEAEAWYTAGGPTGTILKQLLNKEAVSHHPFEVEAWTRENLIVYEEQSGQQFRFGMPGPTLSEDEWRRCLDGLAERDPAPGYLVASGSLPPGVPDNFYSRVAEVAADLGARCIIDTSGDALRQAVASSVFLLKPNVRELQQLTGRDLVSEAEQKDAARTLISNDRVEVVVLSLGAGGALMITAEDCEHVRTPTVPIKSKVGAGDSMVGGIVLALARGLDVSDAVRFGVAAGAAAVMTPGTELCRREDTKRLFEQMSEGE
jgi:6-phosphofructokinase 2